jgi:hypothetical protein
MNRRTALALGGTIAAGALLVGRWSLPRYRVSLWGLDTGERIGEWEVSAVEQAPGSWRQLIAEDITWDHGEAHLWIDPLGGSDWDDTSDNTAYKARYPGQGAYAHGRKRAESTASIVLVWGSLPWGEVATQVHTGRGPFAQHGGLGVEWERVG